MTLALAIRRFRVSTFGVWYRFGTFCGLDAVDTLRISLTLGRNVRVRR
jgi:hypothetical protein